MSERAVLLKKAPQIEQHTSPQSQPKAPSHENQPSTEHVSFITPHFGHDFSRIRVQPPSTATLQPKLTVNTPGDQFEQEAEQVAEEVMRMEAPNARSATSALSEKHIHRKATAGDTPEVSSDLQTTIDTMRGGGQQLDAGTRAFMEPRFGHSFANVRVHTDARATEAARAVHARAFTVGHDIAFDAGQYQPNNDSGRRLLAHELTHVVQQGKEIRRYRNTGAFNFGTENDATLSEDSFDVKKDRETKPWIKQITVEFDSLETDVDGNTYSSGTASVQYYDNPVKLPDFSFTVSGGSQTLGKSDSGTFTVWRIEGIGYNSGSASGQAGVDYDLADREGPNKRYSKDLAGNMNYAVFYNKGEALHAGPLDYSSHGCVHVDWTDDGTIKQLNYHSVIGLTKVNVKYLSKEEIEQRRIAEQVERERLQGADEHREGGHGVPAP